MTTSPRVAVIVLAAGTGVRLGHNEPKAFVTVGGRTILSLALEPVFAMRDHPQVIVTAPHSYLPLARQVAEIVPGREGIDLTVMSGGETRQQSVAAALTALADSVETVLIHDAARPLTPSVIFDSVAAEVGRSNAGVIPGLPVNDTIKRIDEDGVVDATLDRSELAAIQTPQGFPRDQIVAAHADPSGDFTDDAALVAARGYPVSVIAGDQLAFKITTAWELRQAESTLANSLGGVAVRVGSGVDVHAFSDDPSRPLWLGGVLWPGEVGLHGHSDGDVVAHAICDALLSAARLGDMGLVFGSDDPQYANASGELFLRRTLQLIHAEGLVVGNVAVQLVGNRPRMGERRREIELHLSGLLDGSVSIIATTTDALGFTGRGEGVAAIATALVHGSTDEAGARRL